MIGGNLSVGPIFSQKRLQVSAPGSSLGLAAGGAGSGLTRPGAESTSGKTRCCRGWPLSVRELESNEMATPLLVGANTAAQPDPNSRAMNIATRGKQNKAFPGFFMTDPVTSRPLLSGSAEQRARRPSRPLFSNDVQMRLTHDRLLGDHLPCFFCSAFLKSSWF